MFALSLTVTFKQTWTTKESQSVPKIIIIIKKISCDLYPQTPTSPTAPKRYIINIPTQEIQPTCKSVNGGGLNVAYFMLLIQMCTKRDVFILLPISELITASRFISMTQEWAWNSRKMPLWKHRTFPSSNSPLHVNTVGEERRQARQTLICASTGPARPMWIVVQNIAFTGGKWAVPATLILQGKDVRTEMVATTQPSHRCTVWGSLQRVFTPRVLWPRIVCKKNTH